jgi:acetyl-CoA carboxylase carboxyltransferase component
MAAKTPDPAAGNDWKDALAALEERRATARAMGGPERVDRLMTQRGKLDARQRLALLFDEGSFAELGTLVGGRSVPGDALVAGHGTIHGRRAIAAAEDFTVLGGSIGNGSMAKRNRVCELALQEGIPLVFLLDGAGHRLTETGSVGRAPSDLIGLAECSGEVPMVCLVLGASAGHGALTSPLSDFTIMSEAGAMFTGGPPLVKAALGEDVTKEELGGPKVCAEIAGTAHNVAPDDPSAIELARRYLAYMPQNRHEPAPRRDGPDAGPRLVPEMLELVPVDDRKPYRMRRVIERVVDEGSFLEIQPKYGASLVTGLAFLGGQAVAVVANDPWVRAGAVDSAAAIKAMDFIATADGFNLPLVFLADNPGVLAGTRAEREGILKWGGKMFKAQHKAKVPKLHVTFRKAFGFGSSVMAHNPCDGQTLVVSFPSVTMGSMPAGSGGRSAKLDAETQREVERKQEAGPWALAAAMTCDEVIDPREIRNALLSGLALAEQRIRHPAR